MKSFRLLTAAVFAAFTIPRLAHRGMFVDGVTYAAIARNVAQGRGTFWAPFYTATIYPQFHDHPPLGFWLQSLWFRVLGDHLYVERLYSLAVAILTAGLIAVVWRRLHESSGANEADCDWLPVLMWIAVPVVSWAVVGNLLETTVAFFTTLATLAALSGTCNRSPARALAWGVLSGAAVVAAVLVKGPIGLFVLVAPVAFRLLPEGKRFLPALAGQWLAVGACGVGLASVEVARSNLAEYWNVQIVASIAGTREVSASSMTIVKELAQGVLLPMAAVTLIVIAFTRGGVAPSAPARRQALPFLALGLAATLPILVSTKQAGHYLVPSIPLFALAFSIALKPTVDVFVQRLAPPRRHWIDFLTAAILLVAVAASFWPNLGRDRGRLRDLDAIAAAVPRSATIGICPEANDDWGLHAWFERLFEVSLDAAPGRPHAYFLKTAPPRHGCPPEECVATTDSARTLAMMRCHRTD
jgi:4-amino-4-deoxy-L-arabinose transferase-like glycosyltransferase